jgi:outer membrane receptor for ferrienterochelin and colicins
MNKIVIFIISIFPLFNYASDTKYIDSLAGTTLDLNEVVVTAQYAPQSAVKSIHKINIINREQIELSASQNLRDVLRNEMNIRISQDNILGSSMSLQGLSGENVKILIDGVPVIGRQDGNIDLSQINLNNIERIEIVEGPLSVNYGTNALAGVINLISKQKKQERLSFGLQSYAESIGQYNLSANTTTSFKNSQFTFSLGRNYFDGWNQSDNISLDFSPRLADSSRFMLWKPKLQYFGEVQWLQSYKDWKIKFKSFVFNEKITNAGKPRAPYFESAFDDFYFTTRIDHFIQVEKPLSKSLKFNALLAFNHYKRVKNTYFNDLTSLTKQLTLNEGDQDTSYIKMLSSRASLSSFNLDRKLNFELGYDVNIEQATGFRIENKKQSIADLALFASIEIKPIKDLILKPAMRIAYNSDYTAPLTPSLNLKYNWKNNWVWRASYARGFRSPSLKELYFYFVDINHNIIGNSSLNAEYSHNFSIASSYLIAKNKFAIKVEPSLFYNSIDNLISLAQISATEFTYVNIGTFRTKGFQLSTNITYHQFKWNLAYSVIGRYNILSENTEVSNFSYSPEFRFNTQYEIENQELSIAVFYKYSGVLPQYRLNSDTGLPENAFIESYHTMDITINKYFLAKSLIFGFGVKNLFDLQNINSNLAQSSHSSANTNTPMAMGRSYFIKLDYTFKKL